MRLPTIQKYRKKVVMKMKTCSYVTAVILLITLVAVSCRGATIEIRFDTHSPLLSFAADKLDSAVTLAGHSLSRHINDGSDAGDIIVTVGNIEQELSDDIRMDSTLDEEGFQLSRSSAGGTDRLYVFAPDETGGMYGILEVAEQFSHHGNVASIMTMKRTPRFPFRAIKFNLPWSSYRTHESLRANLEVCKDTAFWKSFIDMMAVNRFNALTLWNIHPFPYMIRPQSFPLACPFSDSELSDWKQLYTTIFRHAKERGVKTYIVNWNIFVSEAFKEHYDSEALADNNYKGRGHSTPQIKTYTSECVAQVIKEYPDLAGIGVSLGEGMNGMSSREIQNWIRDVYFPPIENAGRPVEFIHRAPFSGAQTAARTAIENSNLPRPVWVEIKFNWSHAYASPEFLFTHGAGSADDYRIPVPTAYKNVWMIRNEDFFTLRWAQPQYIREIIYRNGQADVGGFFIGSECFIPASDYSHIPDHAHVNWNYAFQKNKLYYELWGRLTYDETVPDATFAAMIDRRYGTGTGAPLLEAYAKTCNYLQALGVFAGFTWDYTLYMEGFMGKSKLISLEDIRTSTPVHSDYQSVAEMVEKELNGESNSAGITPLELAGRLDADAEFAAQKLQVLPTTIPALQCEIADVRAWCLLGRYFADKLRGAVSLERYMHTGLEGDSIAAVESVQNAVAHWQDLIDVTNAHYHPHPLGHIGKDDYNWEMLLPKVLEDLDRVGGKHPTSTLDTDPQNRNGPKDRDIPTSYSATVRNSAFVIGIPRPSLVVVNLYDSAGRLTAKLGNRKFGGGRHHLTIPKEYVAPGLYVYQVKAGEYSSRGTLICRN